MPLQIYNPTWQKTPRTLTDSETQSLDPEFQKANPTVSTLNRPRLVEHPRPLAYQAGAMMNSPWLKNLGSGMFDNGPAVGALTAGVAGYGGGKLLDYVLSKINGGQTNFAPWLGAAGAALGGTVGYQHKQASSWGSSKEQLLQQIIYKMQGSPGIPWNQQQEMHNTLSSMGQSELEQVWDSVRHAAPYLVGALLTRMLLGTGVIGSAVGGFLTGNIFNALTAPRNEAGQQIL